ncbi:hypothetical protein NDU88_002882 [Pleurodeles waltl]|uniref:Uncharacterized protein n=1 Tax=Pleurodeles waltl TaxID=8319 RepID=A0AAV7MQ24_PLEWA|nr:hypothetical protein NDU88_002882 [Pleurodeles waltl]
MQGLLGAFEAKLDAEGWSDQPPDRRSGEGEVPERAGLKDGQDGPSGVESRGHLSGCWAGRRRRDQSSESGSRSGSGEERNIWDIIQAYGLLGAPRLLGDMK